MKTIPINSAPFTAALYLRKCEEKKNSMACRRIDLFERIYRGAWLGFAGCGLLLCGVAFIQIGLLLSK